MSLVVFSAAIGDKWGGGLNAEGLCVERHMIRGVGWHRVDLPKNNTTLRPHYAFLPSHIQSGSESYRR
jgi:hypothetical protein